MESRLVEILQVEDPKTSTRGRDTERRSLNDFDHLVDCWFFLVLFITPIGNLFFISLAGLLIELK